MVKFVSLHVFFFLEMSTKQINSDSDSVVFFFCFFFIAAHFATRSALGGSVSVHLFVHNPLPYIQNILLL